MEELKKIRDGISKLNFILTKEQKKYCLLVFAMSIISALFELLGVSIIIPLLQAFLTPDTLKEQFYIAPFVKLLHLTEDTQIIIFVCVSIIIVYTSKNLYSIFYIWVSNKFSNKIKRETSVRILSTYMEQGYAFFVNNNTARLVRGMDADVVSVYSIILQLFQLCSMVLTILGIVVFIILEVPELAFFLCLLVVLSFALIQVLFKKSMQKNGKLARQFSYKCNHATYEVLQGSKEVLVTNRQNFFIDRYTKCLEEYNRAQIKLAIGQNAPKNIIEGICIAGLMVAVALEILLMENSSALLMQMGTIAVAAFRILPSLGAILNSINTIVFHAPSLSASYDTLYMIKQLEKGEHKRNENSAETENGFQKELVLSHLTFSYDGMDRKVVDDLCLSIKKGTSIALIGLSGAGKTTLSDIILGLFKPQGGKILMDGIDIEDLGGNWNKIIGYVPQSIYLLDASVRRNVAFGIEDAEIDEKKIWNAIEMAQLKSFVEELPEGLNTKIGELGVRFSGGQRQRLAIARALYSEPDIIILDEATAALDTETETAVMESIEALRGHKTLIIVAHRLTTIRNCDVIYEIKDGKAVRKEKEEVFAD